ncbi:MAG: phosphoserine phosphatase SerB [Erythrobacter sp.]
MREPGALERRLDQAGKVFAARNMPLASATLLDVGEPVIELRFAEGTPATAIGVIEQFFAPVDLLVAEDDIVVPRLFVSDMDSTMIGQECIDELADYAGLKEPIAAITERAMRGELDFADALHERVALLEGLEQSAIERCLEERIVASPGAAVLVATLKSLGCRCVLVTGGFHHFADVVAEMLGFDRVVGNRLAVEDRKLTGKLEGDISDAGTKLATLRSEAEAFGANARTCAAGDGANDIPMIEAADYGFAYRAKPKARAAANGRIERAELTTMLSLLGVQRRDWVEG